MATAEIDEVDAPPAPAEHRMHLEFFARLAAPFPAEIVRNRMQGGRTLYYVTASAVRNRLDEVCGPSNWWARYARHGEKSILCRLYIRLPDGSVMHKDDVGGPANMPDAGDDDKSAISDALKRAASTWGVGRELSGDGLPAYVVDYLGLHDPAPRSAHDPDPEPPSQARPPVAREAPRRPPADQREQPRRAGDFKGDGPPRSGKALYAWTLDQEKRHDVGLLKFLNAWAKLQEFPGRMIDWDAEQVALAHAEAVRKLQSYQSAPGDAFEGEG